MSASATLGEPRSDRLMPGRSGREPPPPPNDGGWGDDRDDAGRPRGIEQFAMAWFLASEAMVFGVLVAVHLATRWRVDEWPPAGEMRLPLAASAFNSLFLFASGWTMGRAERAIGRGEAKAGARHLGWTTGLAAGFLMLQGVEWARLINHGFHAAGSLYAYLFYVILGVHGLHVLCALASLIWVTVRQRRYGPHHLVGVTLCRMFWWFVVGVWPVLYGTVYLI